MAQVPITLTPTLSVALTIEGGTASTPTATVVTGLYEVLRGPPGLPGQAGQPGAAGSTQVSVLITAAHVAAQSITLPSAPQGEVFVSVVGGTDQREDVDFTVNANVLSWHGLAMDLLVEAGDYLSIFYR
jgi:hypothetical protein